MPPLLCPFSLQCYRETRFLRVFILSCWCSRGLSIRSTHWVGALGGWVLYRLKGVEAWVLSFLPLTTCTCAHWPKGWNNPCPSIDKMDKQLDKQTIWIQWSVSIPQNRIHLWKGMQSWHTAQHWSLGNTKPSGKTHKTNTVWFRACEMSGPGKYRDRK